MPAGQTDFALRHFSIAHDQTQILPLLRRAKQLNPALKVMATPWSPPAWMKTGDSLVGGRLKDDPAIYNAYARYLVKFVQAYAAAGVPVDFLSVQNEPQNRTPERLPGHGHAGAAGGRGDRGSSARCCAAASPRTKILGYDHNWTTHPGDVGNTPPGEDPETDYPYQLLEHAGGASGSPVRRTTATPATRARRPRCTRPSRRRGSGSPSAPARTAPATPRSRSSAAR